MNAVRKRMPRNSPSATDRLASRGRLEKRRGQLLQEAEALFMSQGYAGTSVNEIVRRAGGSLATLYSEFGSKERLFSEIMRRRVTDLFGSRAAQCRQTGTARASLIKLATQLLERTLAEDSLAIYRIAISEGPHFVDLRDAILEGSLPQFLETLGGILVELGVTSRPERIRAAELFVALVQSQLLFRAACGGRNKISRMQIGAHITWAVDSFLKVHPAK